MVGTLFSVIIGIYLFFHPLKLNVNADAQTIAVILFIVGTLTLFTALLITLFSWAPLQLAEQNTTPGVIRTFSEDKHLKLTTSLIIGFVILTYVFCIDLLFLKTFNTTYLLIAWTIILGIAIDFVRHLLHRVMNFLDPVHVIDFFGKKAQETIRRSDFKAACEWIDTFSDVAMKAISKHHTSLSTASIDHMRTLIRDYLALEKNIHFNDEEEKDVSHVNYTLFYLFQQVEMIFEAALKAGLEPVCSHLVTMLGKTAIYCAKFDLSLANYPLFYIGKLSYEAQKKGLQEVGNRAGPTMLEVSKTIVSEVDIQYIEIKETFSTIVDNLHRIAKETFRNDKSTNINLLMQPFLELKKLFQTEKLAAHQDTPVITNQIDQVLNEFTALETVLNTLPPIPDMEKERERMEKEQETPQSKESPQEPES